MRNDAQWRRWSHSRKLKKQDQTTPTTLRILTFSSWTATTVNRLFRSRAPHEHHPTTSTWKILSTSPKRTKTLIPWTIRSTYTAAKQAMKPLQGSAGHTPDRSRTPTPASQTRNFVSAMTSAHPWPSTNKTSKTSQAPRPKNSTTQTNWKPYLQNHRCKARVCRNCKTRTRTAVPSTNSNCSRSSSRRLCGWRWEWIISKRRRDMHMATRLRWRIKTYEMYMDERIIYGRILKRELSK